VQPGGPQRAGLAGEQHAIGRQGKVPDRGSRRQELDEPRQIAPEERFAARQAHAVHAQPGKCVREDRDLLEIEEALARQPRVVRLGHAVLAAQIAPVSDGDAQAAQWAVEAVVDQGTHYRPRGRECPPGDEQRS
jgi:hypothetical protein